MRAISETIVRLPSLDEITVSPEFLEAALWVEREIRSHCHNPNSYDGYSKTWGSSYTYPVHCMFTMKGDYGDQVFRDGIWHGVKLQDFCNAHCKFGSNHLYTGQAAIQILHLMEYIYGIDITELEKKKSEKDRLKYRDFDMCNKSMQRFLQHKGIQHKQRYISEDYMVHWVYERNEELDEALEEYNELHKQKRMEMVEKNF